MIEKTAAFGLPNCYRIGNGGAVVTVTTDAGPRILAYALQGGVNVLGEWPDLKSPTPHGEDWRLRGGHRLWAAPESPDITYAPDNGPVEARPETPNRLKLVQSVDQAGLQKAITVTLDDEGSGVTLQHRITNKRKEPIRLAPWALTVMRGGGTAIIPQEPYKSHDDYFLPARPVILWHYTDPADPRIGWGPRFIRFRSDPTRKDPTKLGVGNKQGWAAYAVEGLLFVKRFPFKDGAPYPDDGSSCEFYTAGAFMEVETLGPLVTLAPGEAAEHAERWGLFPGADPGGDDATAAALAPLLDQVGPPPDRVA